MKIQDEDRHLLTDSELNRVPYEVGVFLLWQGDRCLHIDEGSLRTTLPVARAEFPSATHFSLVMNSYGSDRFQIVEKLRILYGLTDAPRRPIGFVKA